MAKVLCDDCSKVYDFDGKSVRTQGVAVDGVYVEISYFTCPYCHKPNIVSVTDNDRERLVSELEKAKKTYRRYLAMKNGESLSQRAFERVKRLTEEVSKATERLVAICNGRVRLKSYGWGETLVVVNGSPDLDGD